jgi:hypothetical protein
VTGRVDEIDDVAVPLDPHVLRFDRDAALALQIHRVEELGAHVARVDRAGHLEQPVGQRRLAVVDVRNDAEAADSVEGGHSPAILADPSRPAVTMGCSSAPSGSLPRFSDSLE